MESVIKVEPIQTQEAQEAVVVAERMLTEAKSNVITDQFTYEISADALKVLKAKAKSLEDRRKEITKPLDAAKKSVMELFRKPLIMLIDAERIIKKAMITYTDEQERQRREKEEKLRRQAEAEETRKRKALEEQARKQEEKAAELRKQAAEADAKEREKLEEQARKADEEAEKRREKKEEVRIEAPVLASTVEQPKGVAYKDRWYAVVTDKTKIPMEYLEPNMPMLNKFAQATKGKINLPGVEFKSEKIVASRI